ncbi:hypothetical protein BDF21DRAFT_423283 [Thamnidium elegans]|uniref:Uncharacterized protein n=1 Tax=Thamnidium elegans TaxID=101142 RepID=A0A8H7SWE4_9FUNG|nr:hypothetical protein INT48_003090 [Thamnidium elegans]KAI8075619.1 hypothetical protein BDF21DRAFT_423283 [Thamnidium elegans]
MKGSIRNLFGLNKKSKDSKRSNTIALNEVYSPSSSVSSFSSDSSTNDSAPSTPTHGSMQENRGIFRTLEPVWYFQSNLIQRDTNEWIRFDDQSQYTLENAMTSNAECVLPQSSIGSCTILFRPRVIKSEKKQRQSMVVLSSKGKQPQQHASMPTLHTTSTMGRTLELNKQVRRTISPAWWFEQDSVDGSKGMCRFDHKNQVRLEALSDGRTRLVLKDDAFNVPFTAVLDAPKQPELREEVRGFLYFEPISSAFQLAYNATLAENKFNEYIQQEEIYSSHLDEQWATSLTRRCSV